MKDKFYITTPIFGKGILGLEINKKLNTMKVPTIRIKYNLNKEVEKFLAFLHHFTMALYLTNLTASIRALGRLGFVVYAICINSTIGDSKVLDYYELILWPKEKQMTTNEEVFVLSEAAISDAHPYANSTN